MTVQCPACNSLVVGDDYLLKCVCGTFVKSIRGFQALPPKHNYLNMRCDECGAYMNYVETIGRIHSFKCSECDHFQHRKSGAA